MIEPTVGRVVWYRPGAGDVAHHIVGEPLAALIVHVWNARMVNLVVFDANGYHHSRTSVVLDQGDGTLRPQGSYCEWMPYQKGQAAKTEALEAKLAGENTEA